MKKDNAKLYNRSLKNKTEKKKIVRVKHADLADNKTAHSRFDYLKELSMDSTGSLCVSATTADCKNRWKFQIIHQSLIASWNWEHKIH